MDVGLAGLQDALREFGLMLSIRPHLRRHVSNDLVAFTAVGVGSSLGAERCGSHWSCCHPPSVMCLCAVQTPSAAGLPILVTCSTAAGVLMVLVSLS